jgi:Domain of unknown function (DUF2017)
VSRFRAPVRRTRHGVELTIGADERALVGRLLGELRELLTAGADPDRTDADQLVRRLFPTVHPDDPEAESEYQRLTRDELVASRLASIEMVDDVLRSAEPLSDAQAAALMQSLNAVRLVLGTMLGVGDDPDEPEVVAALEASPEYQLYGWLSWLLEWTVRAQA